MLPLLCILLDIEKIMKAQIVTSIMTVFFLCGYGQKPVIDSNAYKIWTTVSDLKISDDGNYICYTINNLPTGSSTLVLKGVANSWEKLVANATSNSTTITRNGRWAICTKPGDSICIIKLGTNDIENLANVGAYQVQSNQSEAVIAYILTAPANELVLVNLDLDTHREYKAVSDYLFSNNGKLLLIKSDNGIANVFTSSVQLITLNDYNRKTIWASPDSISKVDNFTFDDQGGQISFEVEKKVNNKINYSIWSYQAGMDNAVLRVFDQSPVLYKEWNVSNGQLYFSKDGNRLFFKVKRVPILNRDTPYVLNPKSVDLWSYHDKFLPTQEAMQRNRASYLAVIPKFDTIPVVLNQQDDQLSNGGYLGNNDYLVIPSNSEGVSEFLNPNRRYWLVSTRDGSRKLIADRLRWETKFTITLSPAGKYVLYFDAKVNHYLSYNIAENRRNIIAKDVSASNNNDVPAFNPRPFGIGAWLANDSALLIYDQYDIWEVDPQGVRPSLNLTLGFGKRNKTTLRISENRPVVDSKRPVLLEALNLRNFWSGFYMMRLGSGKVPELLTMGPYAFSAPLDPEHNKGAFQIVKRESVNEAPNYYITHNFKTFSPLTNIRNQQKYNWMTSELVSWKMLDGNASEGVLYKPENFDPGRKYPVIFYIYEKLAGKAHTFLNPDWSIGPIDIPTFVSNGYLVFLPDIYYQLGRPGKSAVNSVVSAVKYLSGMPYVDPNRIGIEGHSFGGYEVNYLVTHTHIFAAAVAASAPSDFVSSYGGLFGLGYGGGSMEESFETGQFRLGNTLWQSPDAYILNSPVFVANRVTTPLLMMNNLHDYSIPFSQGVEFFSALRRLRKKVWMLQYDDENHVVGGEAGKDYTVRMSQFFDYYLKNTLPARWMTEGVPLTLKGFYSGVELDSSGKRP
jgi:dipeptidyl aminopeptidase/acylaminoacyl peptidase